MAARQDCSSPAGRAPVRERIWRRARGFAVFAVFFCELGLCREGEKRLPKKPLGAESKVLLRRSPFSIVFCLLLDGESFLTSSLFSLHFPRFHLLARSPPS
jgi:hypothetical protein